MKSRKRKRPSMIAAIFLAFVFLICGADALLGESGFAPWVPVVQTEVESEVPGAEPLPAAEPGGIPAYSGMPYVVINGNVPEFTDADRTEDSFEVYSELDALGRCGAAYANVGLELMPTEERGLIRQVKPTGWHLVKYDIVDGVYLYNRCHLIGYQLTGENSNENNLITGTRYLNVEGMMPFENMTANYIRRTGNHVLYRVTPVFEGDNLLASGVRMEAESVEDGGAGLRFHVYCYNVQPGIRIDYATGDSELDGTIPAETTAVETSLAATSAEETFLAETTAEGTSSVATSTVETSLAATSAEEPESDSKLIETGPAAGSDVTYILNTNTHRFHVPSCPSVRDIRPWNRQEFTGTRDEAIALEYVPCGVCRP